MSLKAALLGATAAAILSAASTADAHSISATRDGGTASSKNKLHYREQDTSVIQAGLQPPSTAASRAHHGKNGDRTLFKNKFGKAQEDREKLRTLSHFLDLDASLPYQKLDHAGVAITESSAIILMKYMSEKERTAFLKHVFAPRVEEEEETRTIVRPKPHLTAIRITMGSSDFNENYYSYDDLPETVQTDYDLKHFSIAKDEEVLIPALKEIKRINPRVKILATPWTAPGWMKSTNSIYGGSFLGEPCTPHQSSSSENEQPNKCRIFETYADYFSRYVESYYTKHGLAIDYLNLQNEPLHQIGDMPTMLLTSRVAGPLGAAIHDRMKKLGEKYSRSRFFGNFVAAEPFVIPQIFGYDHNWNNVSYPVDMIAHSDVDTATILKKMDDRQISNKESAFAGAAFHCYGGDVTNQTAFHEAYPDAKVWMTECTGGGWATKWSDNLHWAAANLYLGNIENYGSAAFMWNLVLTPDGGPRTGGGCSNCRGVFSYDLKTKTLKSNEDWFPLQNFATVASLSSLSSNGGDTRRISAVIDGMPYPLVVTGSVNTPGESAVAGNRHRKARRTFERIVNSNNNDKDGRKVAPSSSLTTKSAAEEEAPTTLISLFLNINILWCSSGAIHIPFFYTIKLPKSGRICKPMDEGPDGTPFPIEMNILCPSVSTTVFALTDPEERWISVRRDLSFITRNESMAEMRYDSTEFMPDWKTYSNWTCS